MAGKPVHEFSDDQILDAVKASGSIGAAAQTLGVARNTLDSIVGKRGLRARCHELRQLRVEAERVPQPVTDPARVKTEQDAATIKTLKRENGEYAKALASQEEFFERIVEATRVPVKVPGYRASRPSTKKPTRSAIAPIFDQQYGQFVRANDTPGNRGDYGVQVFDQRLARWVEGVTGVLAKEAEGYQIEELIIPFGGDHVEGDEIFPGQPWQLEIDPCRQVWELALKMDSAIREVVRFARRDLGVKFVALYGVDDNHGKVGGKRGGARPATYSWNWLFLKILIDRLRAEPIDECAVEPGGSLFFRCAGHEFQLIHGHQIKGWGGLPFYGLSKFDGRSMRLHNRMFRYLLMGHHHQPAEVPNGAGETIISGDWVGANNLSGMMTAGSRPMQKLLFVSRKWGLAGSERIWFTETDEAYAQTPIYGAA